MARQLIQPCWGNTIAYAYRMTHIDNVPYILDKGFVLPTSPEASPNYVNIGDLSVIAKRKEKNEQGYRLSNYIPFYFGPRSPMLYVIQCGGNGVRRRRPEEIVYCVIKIDALITSNIQGVFTDGHALDVLSKFYPSSELVNLNKHVRVEDVYEMYWKDDESDLDLKRRKEAELLIEDHLSPDLIAGLVVYNEDAKNRLNNLGVKKKIIVVQTFYF